ncbi:MAG: citrate lyase subunit alpha, partial [Thermoplasmata archaeon]|nr:citrate lyase subunit alpha [Thermoplasmata archaeon]
MFLRSGLDIAQNSLGRKVPTAIEGIALKSYVDHLGIAPYIDREIGRPARHRIRGGSKVLHSIDDAIETTGLDDGMTISFHHNLRNGDMVLNMVMDRIARKGIKDLRLFPSALFPVHEPVIDHIRNGIVTSIEGSMNGPIGSYISKGNLDIPVVLRSHSGRARALSHGEVSIDVAFLGVSACDVLGNANGVMGQSSFGPCGYLKADSLFARKTVLITDNIVEFPCTPMSLRSTDIDHIVKVDSIGDNSGIVSGSMKITQDPMRLKIADLVMKMLSSYNILDDSFSFQAGSGGISLAITKYIGDHYRRSGEQASFAVGGTTGYLVDMLNEGSIKKLVDAQSFDLKAIESLRDNRDHIELFIDQYANLHTGGTFTEMEKCAFLSATEVDLDFNVNVNTHSDGMLLHGIGGHQDVAYGSDITVITIPLMRKKNPIIREKVLTITTPGPLIDVVATEKGLAINTTTVRKDRLDRNEELESV